MRVMYPAQIGVTDKEVYYLQGQVAQWFQSGLP